MLPPNPGFVFFKCRSDCREGNNLKSADDLVMMETLLSRLPILIESNEP